MKTSLLSRVAIAATLILGTSVYSYAQWSTTSPGGTSQLYNNNNITVTSASSGTIAKFSTSSTANSAISIGNNSFGNYLNVGIGASNIAGYLWSNTGKLFIGADGDHTVFVDHVAKKVGIATIPQDLFHVHATNYLNGIYMDMQNGSNNGFVKFYPPNINYGAYNPIVASVGKDAGIIFGDNVLGANNGVAGFVIAPWRGNKSGFRMDQYGNIGIGTSLTSNPNGYMLAVNGTIGAKAIQVEITSSAWSDYVFEPDYKLMSLNEVEKYVRKNKHLPEVPSAAEVEEKGIDVASMDNILLRKIEELTLHMIEMKKENEKLKARLDQIETK